MGTYCRIVSGIAFFTITVTFSVASAIQGRNAWSWWYLLDGFYVTLGLFAVIAMVLGICIFFSTNAGQVLQAYFGSFKDQVCPLVKSPWDVQQIDVEQIDVEQIDVEQIDVQQNKETQES